VDNEIRHTDDLFFQCFMLLAGQEEGQPACLLQQTPEMFFLVPVLMQINSRIVGGLIKAEISSKLSGVYSYCCTSVCWCVCNILTVVWIYSWSQA